MKPVVKPVVKSDIKNLFSKEQDWAFWPLVPLYPYSQRRTLRRTIIPETVWTFEQIQGIFYVVVPIRMTVVRLAAGGLLVYAPVAPTGECVRLVNELVKLYGDVRFIIAPTASGLEHKVFVGPFARCFPRAQVFVVPYQWSFPINLPLSWLGLPRRRTQLLSPTLSLKEKMGTGVGVEMFVANKSVNTPANTPANKFADEFTDEFDYAILGPIRLGLGTFAEVALFHRRSRTLLVTDTLVSIPENPPEVLELDPYPLLFHARENGLESLEDSSENRQKGWWRVALFAFYFQPSALEVAPWKATLEDARKAPDQSRRAYWGLYPFRWQDNWCRSFDSLRNGGQLVVAPVLRSLIFNREPRVVLDWVKQVARWDFERIVPCHLDAPIACNSRQFREAFTFLEQELSVVPSHQEENTNIREKDVSFLKKLGQALTQWGIIPPAKGPI